MAGFGGLGTQGAAVASVQALQAELDATQVDVAAIAGDVVTLETKTALITVAPAGTVRVAGNVLATGDIDGNQP